MIDYSANTVTLPIECPKPLTVGETRLHQRMQELEDRLSYWFDAFAREMKGNHDLREENTKLKKELNHYRVDYGVIDG